MSFWRTVPGVLTAVALFCVAAMAAGVGTRVYRVTHPPRQADAPPTLASVVVPVEEVEFDSADGLPIDGWILRGQPGHPFVVLCHALGRSKASVLDLAVQLQKEGFNLLIFDFRGHGRSGGGASSLGIEEKRDVIGAVDFLASHEEISSETIGVYGVEMGAHAAVLAAVDRPAIKVLVLDGLYPDPAFSLMRGVYGSWSFGAEHLGFAPRAAFAVLNLSKVDEQRAAEHLPTLVGRDVLLMAPEADSALAREMERMYLTIPEQRESDGNLVVLPSTRVEELYGEELAVYGERVASFFRERLSGV
jgi:pimeloyl-ACP methyl ester carboxylesterase